MTEVPPWPRSVALYPPTVFFCFLRFYSFLERREGRVTHLLHRYLVYGSEVSVSVFHFKRSNVVSVFKAGGPWRYRCTNLRVKLTVFPICSKCCSASVRYLTFPPCWYLVPYLQPLGTPRGTGSASKTISFLPHSTRWRITAWR